ncbi:SsrA-binding protein, partial [Ilyobacter sp.]
TYNPDEKRVRKLLLHKKEIKKLHEKVTQKGCTIVPISVYTKKGFVKVEIALARGKKNYDKRESLAKRDQQRQMDRDLKEKY